MRILLAACTAILLGLPSAGLAQDAVSDPCDGSSTLQINDCLGGKLDSAEERMKTYLHAAIDRYIEQDGEAVVLGLSNSQAAFEAYRAIECATVYEDWKDGTIRGVMQLTCAITLTDQRTRTIWRNWLTYADSTPPILPEPQPTE